MMKLRQIMVSEYMCVCIYIYITPHCFSGGLHPRAGALCVLLGLRHHMKKKTAIMQSWRRIAESSEHQLRSPGKKEEEDKSRIQQIGCDYLFYGRPGACGGLAQPFQPTNVHAVFGRGMEISPQETGARGRIFSKPTLHRARSIKSMGRTTHVELRLCSVRICIFSFGGFQFLRVSLVPCLVASNQNKRSQKPVAARVWEGIRPTHGHTLQPWKWTWGSRKESLPQTRLSAFMNGEKHPRTSLSTRICQRFPVDFDIDGEHTQKVAGESLPKVPPDFIPRCVYHLSQPGLAVTRKRYPPSKCTVPLSSKVGSHQAMFSRAPLLRGCFVFRF